MMSIKSCLLPDGYKMRRIFLNVDGFDAYGWRFGLGLPLWWIGDNMESLTIRAESPIAALATVMLDGWPPKTM